MKALLSSILLALLFTVGSVAAGEASQNGDHGNCGHYDKFKDT